MQSTVAISDMVGRQVCFELYKVMRSILNEHLETVVSARSTHQFTNCHHRIRNSVRIKTIREGRRGRKFPQVVRGFQ